MNINQIIDVIKIYGITDKNELANFLGQCHHESALFTLNSENGNYRFSRAIAIFPRYKSKILAKQKELKAKDSDYCEQKWLFNTVYGDRLGNEKNGTNDNDGYDYRGGGGIQITGKNNYQAFLTWLHKQGKYLKLTIDTIDDFARTEEGAIISAIWFWFSRAGLREAAQDNNIYRVTQLVNGGENGLADRKKWTNYYHDLLTKMGIK